MTPDVAFGRILVLLLAAVTGGLFGIGLALRLAPQDPWAIPLWSAGGVAFGIVSALVMKRALGA